MKDTSFKDMGIDSWKVLTTGDGINTIYSGAFEASYHSTHGALEESEAIFINLGFNTLKEKELSLIRIFEMGFGTGLNAILTFREADKYKIPVQYTGIEAFPLPLR
ncbi:MAG: hypothetical protein IPN29_10775 [Saprospiraceae bacterium]|nr:hypothetical protein [Saprospiraceae bacterium]